MYLLIIKDWSGPMYVLKNVFMMGPKISVLEFGYECVYTEPIQPIDK